MTNGDDVPAGSVDTEHADDTNTDTPEEGPGDLGREGDTVQHLAASNDDYGDGVSAVSNPDHWTVASGSTGTGGSSLSYMDAYFRRHVRSATPPRTTQRNGTEGIPAISVPAESDGSTPVGFRFTIPGTGSRNIAIPTTESDEFMSLDFRIPGAYAVYSDPNDAGGDRRGMHADAQGRRLSDQTLPTTNTLRGSSDQTMPVTNPNAVTNIGIGIGIGIGTERTTHHGDAMSEPLDPVYRLTEAAVVDDDVVVEAHPVDEDSDLAAHLERHVSLAVEEARQKGRKQRHIVWAGLTFVVLAVAASAVSAAVAITTKGDNTIDSSAPGGGSTHSETAMVDDPLSVLPRTIVGGSSLGFLDDPNRIAAFDWMSKDQISMTLLQSAKDVDEIHVEGEVVLKLRQRYVSALIFLATNGPLWYARLGFLSHKDECDWNKAILGDASAGEVTDFGGAVEAKGLFCNEEGRIQRISLWWNGLSGTLPSELSFLSDSLEGINLAGGSISGTVPSSFGNLAKLKELSLSEHCLTGKLPESLSSLNRLEIVNFFANDHLSGSLNSLCRNDVINWFAADCGDCPGSESHIRCDCCVCCENSSFTCCDKEGTTLYSWMNLAKNPITHRPLSFDRPCLSKESLTWKEKECPCVVYGKSGGICSTDCDGNTPLQDTLNQVRNSFP